MEVWRTLDDVKANYGGGLRPGTGQHVFVEDEGVLYAYDGERWLPVAER